MSSFLLVEDDPFKLSRIENLIRQNAPAAKVRVAKSVIEAIEAIAEENYSLVILDMALPSHTVMAGQSRADSLLSGGLEVLMELSYLNRSDPVVIVTQFPEIEIEGELLAKADAHQRILNEIYADVFDILIYEPEIDAWSDYLASLVRKNENISYRRQ